MIDQKAIQHGEENDWGELGELYGARDSKRSADAGGNLEEGSVPLKARNAGRVAVSIGHIIQPIEWDAGFIAGEGGDK